MRGGAPVDKVLGVDDMVLGVNVHADVHVGVGAGAGNCGIVRAVRAVHAARGAPAGDAEAEASGERAEDRSSAGGTQGAPGQVGLGLQDSCWLHTAADAAGAGGGQWLWRVAGAVEAEGELGHSSVPLCPADPPTA